MLAAKDVITASSQDREQSFSMIHESTSCDYLEKHILYNLLRFCGER